MAVCPELLEVAVKSVCALQLLDQYFHNASLALVLERVQSVCMRTKRKEPNLACRSISLLPPLLRPSIVAERYEQFGVQSPYSPEGGIAIVKSSDASGSRTTGSQYSIARDFLVLHNLPLPNQGRLVVLEATCYLGPSG
jgi:hypothetical protein